MPDLSTTAGFTPKKAGCHRTMSARRPGRSEPTWSAMPCMMAGSMVTFAR